MPRPLSIAAALALAAATPALPAAHHTVDCADLRTNVDGDADRAFTCVSQNAELADDLAERVAELERLVREMREARDSALAAAQAATAGLGALEDSLADAVVAFDDSNGCPDGWSPFREGQSRVLVGAATGLGFAPGLGRSENGTELAEYKYRDHGGDNAVSLTVRQIPAHDHAFAYSRTELLMPDIADVPGLFADGADHAIRIPVERTRTDETGDGRPHENRPPYLAVHFCKRG